MNGSGGAITLNSPNNNFAAGVSLNTAGNAAARVFTAFAAAAPPFVATLVDVTGLVIYFTVASAVLTGKVL